MPARHPSCVLPVVLLAALAAGTAIAARPQEATQTDLDRLMAEALKNRNDAWLRLHDYVLDERETMEIIGDDRLALHALRREYSWFLREGYLIRSPVRSNGVVIGEDERRRYEDEWLRDEQERGRRLQEREAKKAKEQVTAKRPAGEAPVEPPLAVDDVVRQGGQPRFISEAYFMKFPFEPGNYYLAGREEFDGRPVLEIEYYPTRMFTDGQREDRTSGQDAGKSGSTRGRERERERERDLEDRIERSMNKVTVITLWVDPAERQIVRFLFDNADFGFLPYRQIVRVDDVRAEMTMGRYFDGVWLPKEIRGTGAATLATGTFRFTYARAFYDYRMGEVRARIRAYVPKAP